MDQGRRPAARLSHQSSWRRQLEVPPKSCRPSPVRQELPAPVDKLLRPDLKRGNFSAEEDDLIIKLHGLLGNKWSLIAGRLPGRTDNEIKNYWNAHIKRKLISLGIDPQTHRPIGGRGVDVGARTTSAAGVGSSGQSLASAMAEPREGSKPRGDQCWSSREDAQGTSSSTSAGEERLPDLNLDLTISPPPASAPCDPGGSDDSGAGALLGGADEIRDVGGLIRSRHLRVLPTRTRERRGLQLP